LKEIVDYNPDTGHFTWKKKIAKKAVVGARAGSDKPNGPGYLRLRIEGHLYYTHKLAWYYVHGEWPGFIDHINQNKLDNRIENLRSVTFQENCKNLPMRSDNTSGFVGVVWDKSRSKWMARVMDNYREKFLGYFENFDDAVAARIAANETYGFHENHGSVAAANQPSKRGLQ
jgi:hypothetical protein